MSSLKQEYRMYLSKDSQCLMSEVLDARECYFFKMGGDSDYHEYNLTDRAYGDIITFKNVFEMWVNSSDSNYHLGSHKDDWFNGDFRESHIEYENHHLIDEVGETYADARVNSDFWLTMDFNMISGASGQVGFHTMPVTAKFFMPDILCRTNDWIKVIEESLYDWWYDND